MSTLFFSLDSESKLSIDLSKRLHLDLSPIHIFRFADGEWYVKPLISVRNRNVLILQSLSSPVNDNLMKLLIAMDSFRRSGANSITLILPYYCYSRQDRQYSERDPVSSKLVANLLVMSGANKVIFVDIHEDCISSFFDIPTKNIAAIDYMVEKVIGNFSDGDNLAIVSPDYGGIKRAKKIGTKFNLEVLIIEKNRAVANQSSSISLIGDAKSKKCLIVDDMLDTGGTIIGASRLLKDRGASDVFVVVTHALFNGNALEKMKQAHKDKLIEKIYVSDTIDKDFSDYPFIETIHIGELLAESIEGV